MPDKTSEQELNAQIQARFKELPAVVQNAITSANIQKQLRELADIEKLHVDQWQLLENNVMLTLLGFQEPSELAKDLREDLETSDEQSQHLAQEISRIVFEPIREELERELEHPEARETEKSEIEEARAKLLESSAARSVPVIEPAAVVPAPIAAATPPSPPPTEKVARAPASGAYKPGEASAIRKDVRDDPYREVPV